MKRGLVRLPIAAILFVVFGSTTLAATTVALPAPLAAEGFAAQRVGNGLLKWFGLEIYAAALWTPDGTFADSYSEDAVVFSLGYRRAFSRTRLIDITLTAWKQLELASDEQQLRWSRHLAQIWVDVDKGSELTTLVMPAGETRFYDSTRLLGRIDDPAFGPAFLGIWLDARVANTALGPLRAQLMNLPDAPHASKSRRTP